MADTEQESFFENSEDFFSSFANDPLDTVSIVLRGKTKKVRIKRLAPVQCANLFQINAAIKWLEKHPGDTPWEDKPVAFQAAQPAEIEEGELLQAAPDPVSTEKPPRVNFHHWKRAQELIEACAGATGSADQIQHVMIGAASPDGESLFTSRQHMLELANSVPQAEINKIYQAVLKAYTRAREVEKHIKNSEPEPLTGA